MSQYLFSEFSAYEFQELTKILCSTFETNQEELRSLYDSLRSTFNAPEYPKHPLVNRNFFKSHDESFQKLYDESPAVGVDLPSLIEEDNGISDKPVIAVIGQDPMRHESSDGITIVTPYAFHEKGCREKLFTTKLYFEFIKVFFELGYRVYLTDIYKVWVCALSRLYQGVKLSREDRNRFLIILKHELEFIQPTVIVTWGKPSKNTIRGMELGIRQIQFPHPSGAANHAWRELMGKPASQNNKIQFWRSKIIQELSKA